MKKILTICLVTLFSIILNLFPAVVFAYMSSENYILWLDSLNIAGEETSSSTNYKLRDTMGEIGSGILTSENYRSLVGFRRIEAEPMIAFWISANSINFGTLPLGSVVTANHTVSTRTNAEHGYATTIYEDGNLRTITGSDIDDVTDGEVTANFEEYGIRTSGAHGQMNDADYAITSSPQTVASYSSWINLSTVTITYKVSISATTAAGYYSHTVTLVTTGRF
ncbi:MAG: hypothetical protein ABIK19_05730 [candidate division WOR-3 bacterium]